MTVPAATEHRAEIDEKAHLLVPEAVGKPPRRPIAPSRVALSLALALAGCTSKSLGDRPGVDASTGVESPDASPPAIFPPDASTGPVYSDTCWASSLPPPAQPIPPVDGGSCDTLGTSTDWTYPQDPTGMRADDRQYIVGRWTLCAAPGITGSPAHDGIEFGANGRWRLLNIDPATGAYVPLPRSATTSGRYDLFGNGDIALAGELPNQGSSGMVSFANGMQAVDVTGHVGGVYIRGIPSEFNGADNPPPTSDGNCSLVGDWDAVADDASIGISPWVISFDAAGNFVIGGPGADLCASHTASGTYALTPGLFQLNTGIGFAGCEWWYPAGYRAAFDASCDHLSLTVEFDNCNGREFLDVPTTLTRRPASSMAPDAISGWVVDELPGGGNGR